MAGESLPDLGRKIDARFPGAYVRRVMIILPPAVQSADRSPALLRERAEDAVLVDGLIENAFGPGRLAKAAERLREGNSPALDLSLVAWAGSQAVGCVRMWPIHIGRTPAILLGPFAVADAWRSQGLGSELIRQACDAAQDAGHAIVLLVGDD
ncbi:MAG: Acetyltransferase family protein, partial [Caulobacteraceae bacterium]|nr:Acetyltransferase family protein [Caulobacteraceae bacterium]